MLSATDFPARRLSSLQLTGRMGDAPYGLKGTVGEGGDQVRIKFAVLDEAVARPDCFS